MPTRIADLALLSDLEAAALVDRTGAVVWGGFPRFDSPACFAALLGDDEHGVWRIAPTDPDATVDRRYRTGLVLESTWTTGEGVVRVVDFMQPRDGHPDLIRIVEGVEGVVELRSELVLRFDYGSVVPWVRRVQPAGSCGGGCGAPAPGDGAHPADAGDAAPGPDGPADVVAIAGPEQVRLHAHVPHHGEDLRTVATFPVGPGDRVPFVLDWRPGHEEVGPHVDAEGALEATEAFWAEWLGRSGYRGAYADDVHASLAVLKGLTYAPTGGMVAAPTTSLPEVLGGGRNWDYRYCWLRDATFTLLALLQSGHVAEAEAWRDWLVRAVAGQPDRVQIMYGIAGERRLTETELDWLPGHRGSTPVRVGNAAHDQFQLDVFGEVMDALHHAREAGLPTDDVAWDVQRLLMDVLAERWTEPDEGIWEVRGERRHFTHSKVMAWVAADRAVRAVEDHGLDGPVEEWRALRDEIRAEVLERGVDARGVLTQSYGSSALDASLLVVPLVGFLPPDDERVVATIAAIEDELCEDGLVLRYRSEEGLDGVDDDAEGAFLLCSFWLAEALALAGRRDEAVVLFERLLALRNDVGLLAEEVDPDTGELLGNVPQAFSHLAIVTTAMQLCEGTPDDGVSRRADGRRR